MVAPKLQRDSRRQEKCLLEIQQIQRKQKYYVVEKGRKFIQKRKKNKKGELQN